MQLSDNGARMSGSNYSCHYALQRYYNEAKSRPIILCFVIFIFFSELIHVMENFSPQYVEAHFGAVRYWTTVYLNRVHSR